jgi:hypothetical protein
MSNIVSGAAQGALHGSGRVGVIILVAGVGAAARCQITDATAASGTVDIIEDLAAVQGTSVVVPLSGVQAKSGVYLEAISGAGAVVIVELL